MENQQKKIFANCSQTVRNHCEFRNVLATSFALRNPIPHYTVALRNLPLTKPMRNFALPKFAMSSQTNFAMRKFRKANFAMPKPISQCQFQIRNANFNFAMPIHCSFVSQSKPLRNFALRNSQPTLRISQTHFALPNSLPLRNSHLQALSSSVINATDFQTW